jgi:hypothetical protein
MPGNRTARRRQKAHRRFARRAGQPARSAVVITPGAPLGFGSARSRTLMTEKRSDFHAW